MKPNKRKAVVSDPIKRIGLNGGNGAREIVIQIARALGFKIHENEKGVSAYGGNAIRLADHCTYMQTWVDNGTWNAPVRLDIVVEDEPTQAITQVKDGYDFTITEFVLPSNTMSLQTARMIAYDIRNTMNGNSYANNTRGEKRNLVSTHRNNQENKQLNCNRNMKQTIRLTENELRGMISKAVNEAVACRTKRINEGKRNNAVKLTESQLREMINAAVNEALNEMDANDYKYAMANHPQLVGKVDPRTFSDRAKGINAFGKQRNDDKKTMQQGGINSWNSQYGHHGEVSNVQGGVNDHHRYDAEMSDGYNNRQRATGSKFINGKLASEYENIIDNEKGKAYGDFSSTPFAKKAQAGKDVARQMRNGSHGQGWRNK